jgi:hypothetical protein
VVEHILKRQAYTESLLYVQHNEHKGEQGLTPAIRGLMLQWTDSHHTQPSYGVVDIGAVLMIN